jgi:DNA (cytosine-5)-methyltransferase 1
MRVLDLFCGGGGLSCGFALAGHTVVGIDNDAKVIEHARRNLPPPHEWRCADVSGSMTLPDGPFDAIVGGPPCQPYSRASRRRAFEADSRNGVTCFLDVVGRVLPRAVLMEQSPEVLKRNEYWSACLARLEAMGYRATYAVIRMDEWGVPQKRRRLILLAIRGDGLLPSLTSPKTRCIVGDVLPEPPCTPPFLPAHVLARIDRYEHNSWAKKARVLDRRLPARTLTVQNLDHATNDCMRFAFRDGHVLDTLPLTDGNASVDQRLVTIREAAKLHTFPSTWSWDTDAGGPRGVDARVIGNSVPPECARRLALRLFQQEAA